MSENLFEKLGRDNVVRIDALRRRKQLIAVHYVEPTAERSASARLYLVDGGSIVLPGWSKEETTRLFLWLGFRGTGVDGKDTPAWAPHLKNQHSYRVLVGDQR